MSKTALFLLAALAFTALPVLHAATPAPKKKVVTPARPAPRPAARIVAAQPTRVTSRTTATTTVRTRSTRPAARTAVAAVRTAPSRTPVRGRAVAARPRVPAIPPGPSPDRYKEIQQALATKGYYNGEVNGQWGPESVDALKRFQNDQNLSPDGKLGSVSLIALGLGPKRNTVPPSAPASATPVSAEPAPAQAAQPIPQAGARP